MNPKGKHRIKLEKNEAEDVEDSKNPLGNKKDFEEELLAIIKAEKNAEYVKSIDTYSETAHNQSVTYVIKLDI